VGPLHRDEVLGTFPQPSWFYTRDTLNRNPFLHAVAAPPAPVGHVAIATNSRPWSTFADYDGVAGGGFDSNGDQYTSRFAIIFPEGVSDPQLGDASNLARIRRVIAAWKTAHSRCVGIAVVASGEVWGWPDGLWGDGGYWGSSVTVYSAT
jgi:hypothetical protein